MAGGGRAKQHLLGTHLFWLQTSKAAFHEKRNGGERYNSVMPLVNNAHCISSTTFFKSLATETKRANSKTNDSAKKLFASEHLGALIGSYFQICWMLPPLLSVHQTSCTEQAVGAKGSWVAWPALAFSILTMGSLELSGCVCWMLSSKFFQTSLCFWFEIQGKACCHIGLPDYNIPLSLSRMINSFKS